MGGGISQGSKKVDWHKLLPPRGFQVLPRRWVVERTFAWVCHNRRMSKDYEKLCAASEAFVYVAKIRLMVGCLACALGLANALAGGSVLCRCEPHGDALTSTSVYAWLVGEREGDKERMLRTRLCDLLGIKHPIIQASLGPWSSAELVAAVSNAGGLGSFGAVLKPADELRAQLERTKELTDRPFAVNLSARPFNEEVFELTIETKPAVISFAHGEPGELVGLAHEAGILFVQMVNTVGQASQAAETGVDAIIAQGTEAGGFGGTVSTMSLVPQVVDAVDPIPVVAAGGIADGRGLAAALVLGAQGVNIGTRFVASTEAAISDDWKRRILEASSEEAIKAEFANYVFPPPNREGGYEALPRVLRTPFVEEWNRRQDEVGREVERLSSELMEAIQQGRGHELIPFTGQTAGMIGEVLPAGEIVRGLVREAEEALRTAASRP